MPVQIIFVGRHRSRAQSVFNSNAYPTEVRSVVNACATRYALLLRHNSTMRDALNRDISDFRSMVEHQRADLQSALKMRPDLVLVAVYDGLAHLAEMHSSLYVLKSFLDLYAKLIGKLIHPANSWSFGKAKIDGHDISGGRLINALRSQPGSLDALADLTLHNSHAWITEAVRYRDQLSHWSDLDHMGPMHLPLRAIEPHFKFGELKRPTMPNGEELQSYLDGVLSQFEAYIRESIIMLPNVDHGLISPDKLVNGRA